MQKGQKNMSNEFFCELITLLKKYASEMEENNINTFSAHNDEAFEMLTIKEASERFGVSVSSLRAWVRKGKLPDVRKGESGRGALIFSSEILKRFLNGELNN